MLDDNRLERFRPDDDRMLRGYFRIPTSKDIQDAEPTCSHAAVDIALVRFCYIQGSSLRLRMQILPGYLLSANHGCKGRECCGEDRCLICFGGSPRRSSQQHWSSTYIYCPVMIVMSCHVFNWQWNNDRNMCDSHAVGTPEPSQGFHLRLWVHVEQWLRSTTTRDKLQISLSAVDIPLVEEV